MTNYEAARRWAAWLDQLRARYPGPEGEPLTYETIGRKAEVKPSWLADIARARNANPSVERLRAVVRAVGADPAELLADPSTPLAPTAAETEDAVEALAKCLGGDVGSARASVEALVRVWRSGRATR